MTTVERDHAFLVACEGISCRQMYFTACHQRGVRVNPRILRYLSATADDFDAKEIDIADNYVGNSNAMCLLDIIRANRTLVRVNFRGQGLDDACVLALVPILRDHPRLETVDLRDNPNVSDEVVKPIIRALQDNALLCCVALEGTNVSKAFIRKINQIGESNAQLEARFFNGDFPAMKRLFTKLDTDGSGAVTMMEIVAHIDVPQVAAALERKFVEMDSGGAGGSAADGYIHINEFLRFAYNRYVTINAILDHAEAEDIGEATVLENWRTLKAIVGANNIVFTAYHAVRMPKAVVDEVTMVKVVEMAVQNEWECGNDELAASGKMFVSALSMVAAAKEIIGDSVNRHTVRYKNPLIRVPPSLTKRIVDSHNELGAKSSRRHSVPAYMVEVPLELLLTTPIETETVCVQLGVVRQRLAAHEIRGTNPFTLPEWFALINEQYEACTYSVFRDSDDAQH